MADLFADQEISRAPEETPANAPLADRLRPQSLDEVVGQEHLTGPEGAIGRMVAAGRLASMILWGPPGTGKTTIARLLAGAVGMRFVAISAVFSGVADLKKVFAEARTAARAGQQTLLFVDEIHRFNRAQQDGFLPYVEDGTVTLVGATTENPSFELNAALLSRCQVLILRRLALPNSATCFTAECRSTTRTARVITTSSPPFISRFAARIRRRRSIISPACSSPVRSRSTSFVASLARRSKTSGSPIRMLCCNASRRRRCTISSARPKAKSASSRHVSTSRPRPNRTPPTWPRRRPGARRRKPAP